MKSKDTKYLTIRWALFFTATLWSLTVHGTSPANQQIEIDNLGGQWKFIGTLCADTRHPVYHRHQATALPPRSCSFDPLRGVEICGSNERLLTISPTDRQAWFDDEVNKGWRENFDLKANSEQGFVSPSWTMERGSPPESYYVFYIEDEGYLLLRRHIEGSTPQAISCQFSIWARELLISSETLAIDPDLYAYLEDNLDPIL